MGNPPLHIFEMTKFEDREKETGVGGVTLSLILKRTWKGLDNQRQRGPGSYLKPLASFSNSSICSICF